jgi:hypothetical protein
MPRRVPQGHDGPGSRQRGDGISLVVVELVSAPSAHAIGIITSEGCSAHRCRHSRQSTESTITGPLATPLAPRNETGHRGQDAALGHPIMLLSGSPDQAAGRSFR